MGLVSGVIRATESESEESERFHFLHFWLCLWHRRLPSSENHIAGVGSRNGRINQSQCLFPSFVIGLRFFRFCLRLRELSFHLIESDGVVVFNDRKVLRFWLRLRLRLTICLISIIWGLCNDSPTLWKTNIFSIVCKAFLSGARSAFILSQDNKSSQRFKKEIPPLRYICKIAFSRPISSDSCGVTFFTRETKRVPDLRLRVHGRRIRIGEKTISPFNQKWMQRSLSRPYTSQGRLKHGVSSRNSKRSTLKWESY